MNEVEKFISKARFHTIGLKLEGEKNFTEIGYMVGQIVQRELKSGTNPSIPLWVEELLQGQDRNKGDAYEFHLM